jgi:hypothetical protein
MTISLNNIMDKIFRGFVYLTMIWIAFALLFDIVMIYLHFTNPDLSTKIGNEIMWKIDGAFKNDPNNIWYEGPSK